MQGQLFQGSSDHLTSGDNLLPKDGEVLVYHGFFSQKESDCFYDHLLDQIDWQQDKMKIYGKQFDLPRLTAWYGEHAKDYSYSGISMRSKPWTKELMEIKDKIEANAKLHFTSVLLNLYRNGDDSVGWHCDNEKVLRVNPVIASVSLGATRTFKFRHLEDKTLIRKVELTHGTYLLMKGETQHKWEHQIPKTKKVTTPRISLTFRILG
ncbi:MAG: alpha-ketoglutarate-dependent dioxygenase AlkB [Chitinophagales bacterium]|nr:alpha-ketoglutarate-dependent dioxygenase AlkB [Chitinophagales bacterium]